MGRLYIYTLIRRFDEKNLSVKSLTDTLVKKKRYTLVGIGLIKKILTDKGL